MFSRQQLLSILCAMAYGTLSFATTMCNKALFASYAFAHPNVLVLVQMVASVVILWLLNAARIVTLQRVTMEGVRSAMPIAFFSIVNVSLSMLALSATSLPAYSTLKRFTLVFIALLEYVLLQRRYSRRMYASIAFILAGIVAATASDLDFDLHGYVFGLVGCVAQASALISMRYWGADLGTTDVTLYTNMLSAPPLAALVYVSGDLDAFLSLDAWRQRDFVCTFAAAALTCVAMNFSTIWTVKITSALTTSIVGNVKAGMQSVVGFFVFGGASVSLANVLATVLVNVGATLYSYLKYAESYAARSADAASK